MPQLFFFSFLCHYKFGMKRSFIPTLLISPQAFAVFFYDCKKDIMISKACLWSEYTLVFLWSVLHCPIFYPPSWPKLGNVTLPFGYLRSVRPDFSGIGENQFHFGESLKSSALILGRSTLFLEDLYATRGRGLIRAYSSTLRKKEKGHSNRIIKITS